MQQSPLRITDILTSTFRTLLDTFVNFVPNLIVSIVLLLVGIFVGKIVARVLDEILTRIGFNKIGEKINEVETIKKYNLNVKLSKIVGQLVRYFILLVFIVAAADALGVPAISNIVLLVVQFVPKVIAAAILIFVGVLMAEGLRKLIVNLCKSFNIPSGKLISSAVFFFMLIIVIITALGQVGINTALLESSFNLLLGGLILSFSIGYGLASKDILLNVLSSFYSRKKFEEGQVVEIEGVKGEIILIDNTNVVLKSGDQKVIFPLKVLQTTKVVVFD